MGIELASNFDVKTGLPLDSRLVLPDLTARDAIPALYRYVGMLVYVEEDRTNYQLIGGIANEDWRELQGGGSGEGGINYLSEYKSVNGILNIKSKQDGAPYPLQPEVDGEDDTSEYLEVSAVNPIRGESSFQAHDIGGATGTSLQFDFTIDNADKNSRLWLNLEYQMLSAGGSLGDWSVWVWDLTNNSWCRLNGPNTNVDNSNGQNLIPTVSLMKGTWWFQSTDSSSYRMILHYGATFGTHPMVKFGDPRIGPDAPTPTLGERSEIINLTGSGDFTGGSVRVSKTGRDVTVTLLSQATHTSMSEPESASGLLPVWVRPDAVKRVVYLSTIGGTLNMWVGIDGKLGFQYLNTSFTADNRTVSGAHATIAYSVSESIGNVMSSQQVAFAQSDISLGRTNFSAPLSWNKMTGFTVNANSLGEFSNDQLKPIASGKYRFVGNMDTGLADNLIGLSIYNATDSTYTYYLVINKLPTTSSSLSYAADISLVAGKTYEIHVYNDDVSNQNISLSMSITTNKLPTVFGVTSNYSPSQGVETSVTPTTSGTWPAFSGNMISIPAGKKAIVTGSAFFNVTGSNNPQYSLIAVKFSSANGTGGGEPAGIPSQNIVGKYPPYIEYRNFPSNNYQQSSSQSIEVQAGSTPLNIYINAMVDATNINQSLIQVYMSYRIIGP